MGNAMLQVENLVKHYGDVQAVAQRAGEGGDLQVLRTDQVAQLAAAGLRQALRGQVAPDL